MKITTDQIKALREKCGAGVMECRLALETAFAELGSASASQSKIEEKALRVLQKKRFGSGGKEKGKRNKTWPY